MIETVLAGCRDQSPRCHPPAGRAGAARSKSPPVMPSSGSGHSHRVATPSPPTPPNGLLPRSTEASLNLSRFSAGGAIVVEGGHDLRRMFAGRILEQDVVAGLRIK